MALEIKEVKAEGTLSNLNDYVRFNKRAIPDILNKLDFEVAKLSTKTTPFASKDVIKGSLQAASRISPTLRLGELLANKVRQGNGETWLAGSKLRTAGNQYIRRKASGSKLLISGFIPAIKTLAPVVSNKGSSPNISGVLVGKVKGGATPAATFMTGFDSKATLYNAVQGGFKRWYNAPARNISKVQSFIEIGVKGALARKNEDMRIYVERKMNEGIHKFNNA